MDDEYKINPTRAAETAVGVAVGILAAKLVIQIIKAIAG